jgi:hypothetical protein
MPQLRFSISILRFAKVAKFPIPVQPFRLSKDFCIRSELRSLQKDTLSPDKPTGVADE